MDYLSLSVSELIIEIIIFLALFSIGMFIFKKLNNSSNRFLNPEEYLPDEEIQTLKQVYYLILMALCFINVFYSLTFVTGDLFYFTIFDLILSLYIAVIIDKDSNLNKILILFLIPYGSLTFLLFGSSLADLLDFIHIPVFLYFIKVFYSKFKEYTDSNSLSFTILLLFVIIFISFFVTQIVENVNSLDSLVMVSNAFTSNGYAILGHSIPGKINSLFLVWGGYIISGAGTATLTAAILIKHFNKRIKQLEDLIEDNGEGE